MWRLGADIRANPNPGGMELFDPPRRRLIVTPKHPGEPFEVIDPEDLPDTEREKLPPAGSQDTILLPPLDREGRKQVVQQHRWARNKPATTEADRLI